MLLAAASLSLLIWLYLWLLHGGFWQGDQKLDERGPMAAGPKVVAVVPARDEADVIGIAVTSLLLQAYDPPLHVVLVDDGSSDGTAEEARRAAQFIGADDRLTVLSGRPRGEGWTGKMWAVAQGVEYAAAKFAPEFLLLTDADISHHRTNLSELVAKARTDRLDLVSLMVKLHCRDLWERLLIPAFVFFFQKLYPFPQVNDPRSKVAAAAGGCMLVRRQALEQSGGIHAIRGALIDDCALARLLKARGPIWLGLSEETASIRPYEGLGGIWHMVSRTAFDQLRYSWLLLGGTILGMVFVYVVGPLAFFVGLFSFDFALFILGLAVWWLMALLYRPTLALYEQPGWHGLLLPVAGFLYTLMTVDSARRYHQGRGGEWKGRAQAGLQDR